MSLRASHGSVHVIGIGGNFSEIGVKARCRSAAVGHGPGLDALLSCTGPSAAGAQLKKKKRQRRKKKMNLCRT